LEIDPKYALAWHNKGAALANLGRYSEALRCFERALEIDPKYALAWNNKGNALGNLGRHSEALRCFERALEIDPKYALAWHNKGLVLGSLGRHEEALKCFDKALEIDPKYAKAWVVKGGVLLKQLKLEEALRCFERALEIDPGDEVAMEGRKIALQALRMIPRRAEKPAPPPPGTFLTPLEERYELLEFIGEGGFAEVWKARRRKDGAIIALKLPRALTEEGRRVFLQELGVWRLLSGSRHVVELYGCDILSWRGRQQPCIEMELGECSLRQRLPMSVERACRVMFDVAEALAFAHRRGILHRDIKPENIIFVKGVPKLTDFGLAKLKTSRYSNTPKGGTVWYSAPEQFSPSKFGGVGEHTDVYQLGVVFYELLTGELPYDAEEEGEYMHAVLYEEPRPLRALKPEVPEQVEAIVMRCLEKQPERRYKNAGELREALAEYLGVEYRARLSASRRDPRTAIFLYGELLLLHIKGVNDATNRQRALEHLKEAYKFATDILQKYCPDKMKERNEKICRYIKWKLEEDENLPKSLEVPEEFIADVEDFVHKLKLGFERV